jgi:hypothetical protein
MKLVKITMELGIDDSDNFLMPGEEPKGMFTPRYDHDRIANYLNNKLYMDPEFFGEFGPENIVEVRELDD